MPVTSKRIKQIGHSLKSAYSSGTTTINVLVGSTDTWNLHEVRFNLSTGIGTNGIFTITVNSSAGAIHDFILCSENMANLQDVQYYPLRSIQLSENDTIDIAWTNNTTNKFGLEVIYGNHE